MRVAVADVQDRQVVVFEGLFAGSAFVAHLPTVFIEHFVQESGCRRLFNHSNFNYLNLRKFKIYNEYKSESTSFN